MSLSNFQTEDHTVIDDDDQDWTRTEYKRSSNRGKKEFELRHERRSAIFDRALKVSKFAALTQTSILVGLDRDYNVVNISSDTNAHTVFSKSLITQGCGTDLLRRYFELPTEDYQKTEQAFQSFASGFMLAIRDIDDPELLSEIWRLKSWCFRVGSTSRGSDTVCRYLKYLIKCCQSLFLSVRVPEPEEVFPRKSIFHGVSFLNFISEMIDVGHRTKNLTRRTAFILAQISQMGRSGPYASHGMIKEMIDTVFTSIKEEKPPLDAQTAKDHRGGLQRIISRLGKPKSMVTHVSLSGSGCLEQSRPDGGKGAYMAQLARDKANIPIEIDHLKAVVGLRDCFGEEIILIDVASYAARTIRTRKMLWGDVLYTPFLECVQRNYEAMPVPFGLAKLLLLVASDDIQKYGSYKYNVVDNPLKLPLFKESSGNKFVPSISAIPVEASTSVESALKSRLVTSNPAAYVQLGQPINHFMRDYLSMDPFCRVGFDEGDKLWEVLKSYSKYYARGFFESDRKKGSSVDFTVHGSTTM